ncbi:MAG: DNA/RNA nuclease SfsA [Deltaproteobacteria bacterium]|jgi:sugar fermentation stimulation protein A|nr:DNA/RNA nuclease SfsA [Deltaproteobacteria bacterium]MBT4528122.1 DNA/RNA nuclease SfsA [Deltaproteobacteria bacterium]
MKTKKGEIRFPELIEGTLIKRYKRFLTDIRLKNRSQITAHCPNTGTMLTCAQVGQPVYVSYHDNPKRKLKYSWELIKMPTSLVGINTILPNKLVKLSIECGLIKELDGYEQVRSEVKVGEKSRLDLMLEKDSGEKCYIEVKNCTLVEEKTAYFPDAVTSRGLKHIEELVKLKKQGHRAIMFYLIQRMDAERFLPANHIDPAYAAALFKAYQIGIEILVYDVQITLKSISIRNAIPFSFH